MKSEESMVGEDSELAGTGSQLTGTNFTIKKIKFRWKSEIPTRFPNQDEQIGCWNVVKKQYKEVEYVAEK